MFYVVIVCNPKTLNSRHLHTVANSFKIKWKAWLCCMWMCHEKGLKDNFNTDGLFFISLPFFLSLALLLNTVFDMTLLLVTSLQLPSCMLSTLLVVWEGSLNFLMSSVKTPHLLCSHNVCSKGQILVSEMSVQRDCSKSSYVVTHCCCDCFCNRAPVETHSHYEFTFSFPQYQSNN